MLDAVGEEHLAALVNVRTDQQDGGISWHKLESPGNVLSLGDVGPSALFVEGCLTAILADDGARNGSALRKALAGIERYMRDSCPTVRLGIVGLELVQIVPGNQLLTVPDAVDA